MKNRFATRISASILVLILTLSGAALANDAVAKIENAGEALLFYPAVEAKALSLTVTGPCNYRYETTSKMGKLAFRLADETIDGRYTFSLTTTPIIDPEIMEILHKARATGNDDLVGRLCREGRLPAPALTQAGVFTVVERKIVFDATPELRRRADRDDMKSAELSPQAPAAFQVASADLSMPAEKPTPSCDWARMEPGAGVAER